MNAMKYGTIIFDKLGNQFFFFNLKKSVKYITTNYINK